MIGGDGGQMDQMEDGKGERMGKVNKKRRNPGGWVSVCGSETRKVWGTLIRKFTGMKPPEYKIFFFHFVFGLSVTMKRTDRLV